MIDEPAMSTQLRTDLEPRRPGELAPHSSVVGVRRIQVREELIDSHPYSMSDMPPEGPTTANAGIAGA